MKKLENNDAMLDRITLIATLYYKDKLSQQEIAKKLNISRPWVSKLLTRAEELGIVKIEIESPILGNTQLEQQLCDKYQLEYASVIDNSDTSKGLSFHGCCELFHLTDQTNRCHRCSMGKCCFKIYPPYPSIEVF